MRKPQPDKQHNRPERSCAVAGRSAVVIIDCWQCEEPVPIGESDGTVCLDCHAANDKRDQMRKKAREEFAKKGRIFFGEPE